MVVFLDEPKINYWGGVSAAPIFSNIVYRISGVSVKPEFKNDSNEKKQKNIFIFTNLNPSNDMTDHREHISIKNSEELEKTNRVSSPYHMPDLKGLSIRGALRIISEYGIKVEVEGNGIVINQYPSPGKDLRKVEVCKLMCKHKEMID